MALTAATALFAQSFENDACYMEETDEGIQYIQRFEWQQIDYIQKFEFCLEQKNAKSGAWEEIDRVETVESHVELPLDSGSYRYKIVVYNLLGKPEIESDWIPIEITRVYQPVIEKVTPAIVYLENQDGEIILSGSGLLDDSIITFKDSEGNDIPVENWGADDKKKELTFFVDPTLLDSGDYTVFIENEGGLSTSFAPITVKFKKAWDLDVSIGLTGLFNLFDDTFDKFFGQKNFLNGGATARVSFMPWKHDWGYLGIGFNGSYILLNPLVMPEITENYKISGNYVSGYLDFVYQYPIRNKKKNNNVRAIFEGHAGAGIVMLNDIAFNFPHGIKTDPFNVMYLSANIGGAAQYYIGRHLYAELNCDFTFTPSNEITMGNLVPSLSVGWQF